MALFRIGHGHPAKTLFATAQATTAKPAIIRLADSTTRAGNVKKLELLCHNHSASHVEPSLKTFYLLPASLFSPQPYIDLASRNMQKCAPGLHSPDLDRLVYYSQSHEQDDTSTLRYT